MAKSGVKGRDKALLRVGELEKRVNELEVKLDIIEDGVLSMFLLHNAGEFSDADEIMSRLRNIMAEARGI